MSSGSSSDGDDSTTVATINWKKETFLVVFSAIVGGIVFAAVSPFVVPTIHDFQVNQLGAQNPTLGVEIEYAEDVEGTTFSSPHNESYDRYNIIITNPSDKMLDTVTVGFAVPGSIEAQSVGHFEAADGGSYSSNAQLVATSPPDNLSYVTNAIQVDELPPGKQISTTVLVDRSPENGPIPGYWRTKGLSEYNGSRGTIMVSGQYRWQFKGSIYTEEREFTLVNATYREVPDRYDICVGDPKDRICHT